VSRESDAHDVVQAWLAALNNRDDERVLRLSDADIEIVGPRGSARGYTVLGQWLKNTRLTLASHRMFADGDAVVVAQHGIWRSIEDDEFIGEADVASRFVVRNGHVALYARYDNLEEALSAAGLSEGDEITA
jgi:hypothetical protein